MTALENADKAQEVATILLRLNDEWQKCESIKKRHKYAAVEDDEASDNSNSADNGKSKNGDNEDKDDEEFYFDSNEKKKPDEKKPKNQLDSDELDTSLYKIKKIHCNINYFLMRDH